MVPVDSIPSVVEELASEGMLTILLEPASPYSDLYSLASVCDLQTGKVDIEVVGPGFDASDILRSDSVPHERIELLFGTTMLQPKRVHLVESNQYLASVQRRLVKIGARLRNPSFLDEEWSKDASAAHLDELAQEAVQYLQKAGQTVLLDHLAQYEPIPSDLLEAFVVQLKRLYRAMTRSSVPWKALSVAGSFLDQGRLVMWDFFAPGNQDTRLLAAVRAF